MDQPQIRSYGSLDYAPAGYRPGNMVRLDVLVGGASMDALSIIVHRDPACSRGQRLDE